MFQFKIISKSSRPKADQPLAGKARVGKIITPHGVIDTPAFVPVGTKATVKGLTPQDLKECGVQLLFGNTYHLHLKPGENVVQEFGGLAKFMSWNGPTITDSGGFQVFSLGKRSVILSKAKNLEAKRDPSASPQDDIENKESGSIVNITDDGVKFRSHIDGSPHLFTPEKSIEIQKKLGADLILAFDECAPHPSTKEYTKEAMDRTHNWAIRSLAAHKSTSEESKVTSEVLRSDSSDGGLSQALYGIIQGGIYKDLREESARFISQLDFDGIAVGGVAVGESKKEMRDVLAWVSPFLSEEKPRHLLGIGEIDDIFQAVDAGMDTFDCVIPTRFGRYGIAFISPKEGSLKNKFRLQISKTTYAFARGPLDKQCQCNVCLQFTRAYIHHLFRSQELLAYRLVSYHNLYFIINLMKQIREAILAGRFEELKKVWLKT